jgi:hypothetical protein
LSLQDRTYTPAAVEAPPRAEGNEEPTSAPSDKGKGVESPPTPPPKDAGDVDAEEQEESYGFAHPAASRPQRTVWIPKDEFGLAEEEERACREAGVLVGDVHATIDAKGKVDISGGPPDLIQ